MQLFYIRLVPNAPFPIIGPDQSPASSQYLARGGFQRAGHPPPWLTCQEPLCNVIRERRPAPATAVQRDSIQKDSTHKDRTPCVLALGLFHSFCRRVCFFVCSFRLSSLPLLLLSA